MVSPNSRWESLADKLGPMLCEGFDGRILPFADEAVRDFADMRTDVAAA